MFAGTFQFPLIQSGLSIQLQLIFFFHSHFFSHHMSRFLFFFFLFNSFSNLLKFCSILIHYIVRLVTEKNGDLNIFEQIFTIKIYNFSSKLLLNENIFPFFFFCEKLFFSYLNWFSQIESSQLFASLVAWVKSQGVNSWWI